jgi:hypothetical protein
MIDFIPFIFDFNTLRGVPETSCAGVVGPVGAT